MSDAWSWIANELQAWDERGLTRRRRRRESPPVAGKVQLDGRQLVHLGSNDYLGLAADRRLVDAVRRFAGYHGWGSGASPLVAGHGTLHETLERRLAEFEGTDDAVLFASGFAANLGAITALVGPDDLVVSDALNHASIIDAIRCSRARCEVYQHLDLEDLESRLSRDCAARRRLIVSDSVFSMDGDRADLIGLATLAERYGAMLLIDEAHATGVWGEQGRGLHEVAGLNPQRVVVVGTLSKALGSIGGFVAGSASLVKLLHQRARSYMFSTAIPEAVCAAGLVSLEIVRDEPWRRERLRETTAAVIARLASMGWDRLGSTQIVPLRVGDPRQAVALSEQLAEAGFFVPAIRPPAVPQGESLLRLSLTADHSLEMLEGLFEVLKGSDPARGSDPLICVE